MNWVPVAADAVAVSFPLSLSASALAAAAADDSGEGRELGCFGWGGGCGGGAGLLRLNPSEVILREISFEARSTTPGVLLVVMGVLLAEPVLLLFSLSAFLLVSIFACFS